MFAQLGLTRIYQPAAATARFTADDYKATAANMREVGEIASQHKLTFMVELVRNSTLIATLATQLRVTREAGHPAMKPLFDFYHFLSGPSKFEELDAVRAGEIGHVHFQDLPNIPQELMDQTSREIPGDGVAPLDKVLRTLQAKGYTGTLSVELFLPRFQQGDPFQIASEIKGKAEAVMRKAGVLRPLRPHLDVRLRVPSQADQIQLHRPPIPGHALAPLEQLQLAAHRFPRAADHLGQVLVRPSRDRHQAAVRFALLACQFSQAPRQACQR